MNPAPATNLPTVASPATGAGGSGFAGDPVPPHAGHGPWPWIIGVLVLAIAGAVAYVVVDGNSDEEDADRRISEISVPVVTSPDLSIPDITAPDVTFPEITVPERPDITIPVLTDLTVPDFTVPDFTVPDFTIPDFTVPDLPDFTVPDLTDVTIPDLTDLTIPDFPDVFPGVPSGQGLPNGATSLFDSAATGAIVGLLDDELPGEPTQFNMIIIFPDYALASGVDPDDPGSTVGAVWLAGQVSEGPGMPSVEDVAEVFAATDVDWGAISKLVAEAPALVGGDDGTVTHVIIQRWAFEDGSPLRVLVYVDGEGYVQAAPDGTVLATF